MYSEEMLIEVGLSESYSYNIGKVDGGLDSDDSRQKRCKKSSYSGCLLKLEPPRFVTTNRARKQEVVLPSKLLGKENERWIFLELRWRILWGKVDLIEKKQSFGFGLEVLNLKSLIDVFSYGKITRTVGYRSLGFGERFHLDI